mmetsp:Transcript_8997/g.8369  ORF Transcript_8997/g.8369 Transcript_8997/m.8369 type:complete len:88 (-) Transcript_8997:1143-1406(-)
MEEELKKQSYTSEIDFYVMPPEYVRFRLKVEMPSLRFKFFNEYCMPLLEAQILNQVDEIDIALRKVVVKFSLESLVLADLWSQASAF